MWTANGFVATRLTADAGGGRAPPSPVTDLDYRATPLGDPATCGVGLGRSVIRLGSVP